MDQLEMSIHAEVSDLALNEANREKSKANHEVQSSGSKTTLHIHPAEPWRVASASSAPLAGLTHANSLLQFPTFHQDFAAHQQDLRSVSSQCLHPACTPSYLYSLTTEEGVKK